MNKNIFIYLSEQFIVNNLNSFVLLTPLYSRHVLFGFAFSVACNLGTLHLTRNIATLPLTTRLRSNCLVWLI